MKKILPLLALLLLTGCYQQPRHQVMVHLFREATCKRLIPDQWIPCTNKGDGTFDCGFIPSKVADEMEWEEYTCKEEVAAFTPEEFDFRYEHDEAFKTTFDSYEYR